MYWWLALYSDLWAGTCLLLLRYLYMGKYQNTCDCPVCLLLCLLMNPPSLFLPPLNHTYPVSVTPRCPCCTSWSGELTFLLPGVVWCYLCTADGWWSPHSGIGFHICSFCLLRELKTMHHICIFCRWWCRIYCDIVCTWVLSSTVPLMKVISALFALYSFKCSSIHVWSHRLSSSQSKQCSGWPSWSYSLGLQLCYPVAGALAQWCCFYCHSEHHSCA